MFGEPLLHLRDRPLPFKRMSVAAIVFRPSHRDVVDELVPVVPRPSVQVMAAERLQQHLRFVEPRGMRRRLPGMPLVPKLIQVVSGRPGCMSGIAVMDQVHPLQTPMAAVEVPQLTDIVNQEAEPRHLAARPLRCSAPRQQDESLLRLGDFRDLQADAVGGPSRLPVTSEGLIEECRLAGRILHRLGQEGDLITLLLEDDGLEASGGQPGAALRVADVLRAGKSAGRSPHRAPEPTIHLRSLTTSRRIWPCQPASSGTMHRWGPSKAHPTWQTSMG